MDEIRKLLLKARKADRERILKIFRRVRSGDYDGLKIEKVKHSKKYRIRVGRYRIILKQDPSGGYLVISLKLRNERTYR